MGLLQRACETYDANRELAGVYREGHEVLPPIGHILRTGGIEIMINIDGELLSANLLSKEAPKILIPVTEKSLGRSGTKAVAHPLCDKLQYIGPHKPEFHAMYLEELGKWNNSPYTHPIVQAVYKYVQGETILSDLERASIIKCKDGMPDKDDMLICWSVAGIPGEEECWRNHELHKLFVDYMLS